MTVFTPIPSLGLIVVDEEHDSSFKQQEGLHYHARDLAVWRAKQEGIPLVLGSASPSLESLTQVERGLYHYHSITQRAIVEARLPDIHILDMRPLLPARPHLHPAAIHALRCTLERHEMGLVFINRRGYAPHLLCPSCDWSCYCTECSVRMVFHQSPAMMICHHCGRRQCPPRQCPQCGCLDMQTVGSGTQKIEETLSQFFPSARLARVDRDSTPSARDWDTLYQSFHDRTIDLLVGTQMLSKGHDLTHITTVVVLDADHGLYSSHFRASEGLFAQLLQISGRAGRGQKPGQVFIQTHHPHHPLYQAVQHHEVYNFYKQLLDERKTCLLPPFRHFVLIRADAILWAKALAFLQEIYALLRMHPLAQDETTVAVHPPIPALLQRLARRERGQILLEATHRTPIHQILTDSIPHIRPPSSVRWSVDVDPFDMF